MHLGPDLELSESSLILLEGFLFIHLIHCYNNDCDAIFKYTDHRYNNGYDMRQYLLTERERELIDNVLRGERPDGFRQLKSTAKRSLPKIREDLELIEKFLGEA